MTTTIDMPATLWRINIVRDPDPMARPHRRYTWSVEQRAGFSPWSTAEIGEAPTQQLAYSAAWDAWTIAAGIPTEPLDLPDPEIDLGPRPSRPMFR